MSSSGRIRLAILGFFFASAVIFGAVAALLSLGAASDKADYSASGDPDRLTRIGVVITPTPALLGKAPPYTVKEYNGVIAVYSQGRSSGLPDLVTAINTGTLRRLDAEQLREGITVDTYTELLILLEDFGS